MSSIGGGWPGSSVVSAGGVSWGGLAPPVSSLAENSSLQAQPGIRPPSSLQAPTALPRLDARAIAAESLARALAGQDRGRTADALRDNHARPGSAARSVSGAAAVTRPASAVRSRSPPTGSVRPMSPGIDADQFDTRTGPAMQAELVKLREDASRTVTDMLALRRQELAAQSAARERSRRQLGGYAPPITDMLYSRLSGHDALGKLRERLRRMGSRGTSTTATDAIDAAPAASDNHANPSQGISAEGAGLLLVPASHTS